MKSLNHKIKFGVIGCGTVAGYGHIPTIADSKGAELFALADINKKKLKKIGEKYKVKHLFTNYGDLLKVKGIEVVTIATPLNLHYPIVMEAAKQGKHVLCEKPISNNLKEGWKMVKAMKEAKRLLAINFEFRFSDVIQKIRTHLEKRSIGKIKIMRFIYLWGGPGWANKKRLDMLMTEGLGAIVDCGVHFFDLARWLAKSEYKEITGRGIYVQNYKNPDHVIATCYLKNGVMVIIEQSWIYTHNSKQRRSDLRYDIIGDKGVITYLTDFKDTNDFFLYTENKTIRKRYEETKPMPFKRLYQDFIKSIKKGKLQTIASGEDGIRAIEAALLALRLAKKCQ